jgi:serine/threonine protein kinase
LSQGDDPERASLGFTDRLSLCCDCAAAIAFLHLKGIVHVDIKSMNFLVSSVPSKGDHPTRWVAKVCDLEFARSLGTSHPVCTVPSNPVWLAPELNQVLSMSSAIPSFASDVYSFAIVIWEVFSASGGMPFAKEEEGSVLVGMERDAWLSKAIANGLRPSFETESCATGTVVALAEEMWCNNPSERPAMDAVVKRLCDSVVQDH